MTNRKELKGLINDGDDCDYAGDGVHLACRVCSLLGSCSGAS